MLELNDLQYIFKGHTASLIYAPFRPGPLITINFRWGVGDARTGFLIAGTFEEQFQSHRAYVRIYIRAASHG